MDDSVREYGSIDMISGVPSSIEKVSVDKMIQKGRYNRRNALLIMYRLNDAKCVRNGGIFYTEEALQAYIESQDDLRDIDVEQGFNRVVVYIMRKYFVPLITTPTTYKTTLMASTSTF